KWKAGFTANYSDVKLNKLPSGNSSWLFTVYGAPASFDLVGTPSSMPGTLGQYRQISYRRGAVGENPLWALDNNEFSEKTKRIYGNTYLEYKPADWLKIRYQLGVDSYSSDFIDYFEMGSAGTGQALPTAAQYTDPNKPNYTYVAPSGGSLNLYGVNRTNLNSLLNFSLKQNLTDKITAVLDFGNEISDNKLTSYTMLGTGFTVPGWKNMSNAAKQTADNSVGYNRTVGFYGNLSVDYDNLVYLGVTGRNDIVSTMPRGSRSFFYPSVSLGFVFTELEALKNSFVSFGKLRASYANVGQAGTFNPVTYGLTTAGSGFLTDGLAFPLGGISGYGPSSTLYDPNLKPQNTRNVEVGFELKFFNNRVGLDYSYSDQLAKDQIFAVPLAGSTGYSQLVQNAGTMTIKGHEVVLNLVPVKTDDFEWNFTTLFTKYVNECVELAEGVDNISLGGYVTPNIRASAGDTYPSIYGNQFLKNADGEILIDDDPNSFYYGMPLIGEFGKIGDVSPNFYFVFSTAFKYKFLTLSAQLDWKDGGQMYSGSNRLMDLYGASIRTEDRTTPYIYEGVKFSTAAFDESTNTYTGGTANDIQRGGPDDLPAYADLYNDVLASIDEAHIYSTSFVKLREVALNIELPKKWLSGINIQSVSLDLVARNFLLWSPLPNFDPEASQGMGNMQGGMDYMSLPQTSSYGIGLNVTF
ncbi:MAG TPA: SusC/RagA family TonB-linked outer membrane protein, partial [Saprospirales bacterium]|nr:SusC/RagA family TonB-linked outer membrane protein [Saprospirales bacterium]